MRRITRNLLLGLALVVVLLLALGALPGYLKSGDPYYLTATPIEAGDSQASTGNGTASPTGNGTAPTAMENRTVVNASELPANRYPYATAALADATANRTGRSDPYWRGPIGIKGAFTHSPFDELGALRQRDAGAGSGDDVFVRRDGTVYRLAVTQES